MKKPPLRLEKGESGGFVFSICMDWILASASPRRKELLAELIKEFEICPADVDERVEGRVSPKKLVKILARRKAVAVACLPENEGKGVIGSDTVVALFRNVLGKPKDEADAVRMLQALSGKKHFVYTGVCIAVSKNGKTRFVVKAAKTAVFFEKLSLEKILAYVETGSPMDKAGGYGIQDGGLVKKIKGSYANVVGLPVELLEKTLKKYARKLEK